MNQRTMKDRYAFASTKSKRSNFPPHSLSYCQRPISLLARASRFCEIHISLFHCATQPNFSECLSPFNFVLTRFKFSSCSRFALAILLLFYSLWQALVQFFSRVSNSLRFHGSNRSKFLRLRLQDSAVVKSNFSSASAHECLIVLYFHAATVTHTCQICLLTRAPRSRAYRCSSAQHSTRQRQHTQQHINTVNIKT